VEAFLIQLLAWAGPLGIFGGFIWFMVAKKGWAWPVVITSMIFSLLVASAVPDLPQAVNEGITGVVTAFTDGK